MGVTGAGKSSFIKDLTNDDAVEIGHDLVSCERILVPDSRQSVNIQTGTTELKAYTFHHGGYNINLIDTPGFNDTNKTENQILQDIANWLEDLYNSKERLKGIVYLHNIEHPRMEGSALRNLKMFRMLCGEEPLKNVVLATTFWGKVDAVMAQRREDELRTTPDFWEGMLRKGSRMMRYRERNDGLQMIASLLPKVPVTLEIQYEMVEQHKVLGETQAGQAVNEELARLEEKHRAETEKLREEMEEAIKNHDEEMQDILKAQQDKVDRELEKISLQREQLNAERRAERREMKNEYEAKQREMKNEHDAYVRNLEAEYKRLQNQSLEEAVAAVRLKESRLAAEDREKLEKKIAELQQQIAKGKGKSHTGHSLFKALLLVLPTTALALLGLPVPIPDLFGGAS
ncbi:Protein MNN4 [Lasiodiplodia hormozganensis]|uniref:Protein MNN4 n=1 Tax=Lasiodiplodia hormozganensis TaxID=869390 RepID=A0AA40CIV8_9PEZI|nr:Protein MNN4 [Lasiodiplodia hormozganensis]